MDKPQKTATRWGATPDDWALLDLTLGIGTDLLPVVSNPNAEISPTSSMKALGKTPSRYDRHRKVVGISQWTSHQASDAEIARWSSEPDYGICIQTRTIKAIDIDIAEHTYAAFVKTEIEQIIGRELPARYRLNSGKCLVVFRCDESFPKRVIKTANGIVELLSTGQQFIAHGTHPTGVRYEWSGPSIAEAPVLTLDQVDAVWSAIEKAFAIEPSKTSKSPADRVAGEHVPTDDPVADWLRQHGLVLSETRRGLVIECPWSDEHTGGEPGDTSTMWLPAGSGGQSTGHFRCQHAHCDHRNRSDFLAAIGYQDSVADDFENLGPDSDKSEEFEQQEAPGGPFKLLTVTEFLARPRPTWLVKGLIPKADLGVVYGASGAGKSFIVLDIAMAVARGVPWRGLRVKQGKVVYICAEGVGGFRNRVEAYCQRNGINGRDLPLLILDAVPNLLDAKQVKQLTAVIEREPEVALIVCDTFAQMTPGANENAGEDMGKAISHVRHVGRKVGAVTVLIHHAGKDAAKGARGWSGIRAAADFEMEVTADDAGNRALNTTKQKDADDRASWGFRLEEMVIAIDDDGDDVKSAVVLDSDVQVEAGVRGGRRKTSRSRQEAIDKKLKAQKWEGVIIETFQELAVGGDVLKTELMLRADKLALERFPKVKEAHRRNFLLGRALETLCKEGTGQIYYDAKGIIREVEGEE